MGSNKVFISYAHVDKVKCDRVCELLQQYHVEYWKDENGIAPSAEDFNEAIENAIRDCRYFITVWTSGIKNSDLMLSMFSFKKIGNCFSNLPIMSFENAKRFIDTN